LRLAPHELIDLIALAVENGRPTLLEDAGLAKGPAGFLYGATESGGKGGYGTVFRIKP
jgi:hypothetical protein